MEVKVKDLIKKEISKLEVWLKDPDYYGNMFVLEGCQRLLKNFLTLQTKDEIKAWIKSKKKEVKLGNQRLEESYDTHEFEDEHDEMFFSCHISGVDMAINTILRIYGEFYLLG